MEGERKGAETRRDPFGKEWGPRQIARLTAE